MKTINKLLLLTIILLLSIFTFCSCSKKTNKITLSPTIKNSTKTSQQTSTLKPSHFPSSSPTNSQSLDIDITPSQSFIPIVSISPSITAIVPTNNPTNTATPKPINKVVVSFSKQSGYYNSNINLAITCDGNYTIRYTTDGSDPKPTSINYIGPISITNVINTDAVYNKVNVIKAAAFDGNNIVSKKIYTATYIVSPNNFEQRYSTPVISIITDPDNLYNSSTGIMAKYNLMLKGIEWERLCHVDFFETNGSLAFSQDAGLRLFGGTSRNSPLKSFKIFARASYDDKGKFNHVVFPGNTKRSDNTKVINEYNALILRSGANDSVLPGHQTQRSTMIRDGFVHRLASQTGLDFMSFRPSAVYLNGSYYGILNIREDLSDDYVAEHYSLPEAQIAIMKLSILLDTFFSNFLNTYLLLSFLLNWNCYAIVYAAFTFSPA